jgi:hypothetical protein
MPVLLIFLSALWLWLSPVAPTWAQDQSCEDSQATCYDPPAFKVSVDPASPTADPGDGADHTISFDVLNTDVHGFASFVADGLLTVTVQMYGHLDSQTTVKVLPGESVDLGATTLYGGEVTGDNLIDIADLAYLSARFHSDDLSADINGDGQVDILDLAMAAANFLMSGPTPWGE